MKLEFEKDYIPDFLLSELGFDSYLLRLNLDLPFLAHKILSPLSLEDALLQYGKITKIEQTTTSAKIKELINATQSLPCMDFVISAYDNSQLELATLFDLITFLNAHQDIEVIENGLHNKNVEFSKFRVILSPFLEKDLKHILVSAKEKEILKHVRSLEEEIKVETKLLEETIFNVTGLKMYYPFPKEVGEEWEEKINKSPYLKYEKTKTGLLIDYKLGDKILSLIKIKDGHTDELNQITEKKLSEINTALAPYFTEFKDKIKERFEKTFLYSLIFAKNIYNLSWPQFTDVKFECNEGRHPLLESYKKESYSPLTVSFNSGATTIIGANMSGKTSVMRNLYFLTTLCKFGLPIPAKKLTLPFPADTFYMIRSSGRPELNLSSFTEELSFFEKTWNENSYVFIDELFQSTNPSSGQELSKVFLEYFSKSKIFFISSTHYLNLLTMNGVQFFKMLDDFKLSPIDMTKKDFNLEHEIKKPFELCLQFNLPRDIKIEIKTCLEKYKN